MTSNLGSQYIAEQRAPRRQRSTEGARREVHGRAAGALPARSSSTASTRSSSSTRSAASTCARSSTSSWRRLRQAARGPEDPRSSSPTPRATRWSRRATIPSTARGRSSGRCSGSVLDPLALRVLEGEFAEGDQVVVDATAPTGLHVHPDKQPAAHLIRAVTEESRREAEAVRPPSAAVAAAHRARPSRMAGRLAAIARAGLWRPDLLHGPAARRTRHLQRVQGHGARGPGRGGPHRRRGRSPAR